jgi:hypothetical protein
VAFAFSLAKGILGNSSFLLFQMFNLEPLASSWVSLALTVLSSLVSPLLLFGVFYFMGKKIDLVAEFLSVVVPLFLGSLIGHLAGYFPLQILYILQFGGSLDLAASLFLNVLWIAWYVFWIAFSLEFFVAFTALSMSYIVEKRSTRAGV